VTITAAFRAPASFRPIIKINCNSRDPPTALTTGQTFLTTEHALAFGQDMARKWVDGRKGRADRLDELGQKKEKTLTKVSQTWNRKEVVLNYQE
jgi:hypothetical protein